MSRNKGDVVSILAMAADVLDEEVSEHEPLPSKAAKPAPRKKKPAEHKPASDNLLGLEPKERKVTRPIHRLSVDIDAEIYDGFLDLCKTLGRSQRSVVMEMFAKVGGTTAVLEDHYRNG